MESNQSPYPESGKILDLHCPYCGTLFKEIPKGKKRCSNCQNVAYVKWRWGEEQKRLVKRKEALEIDVECKLRIAEKLAADAAVLKKLKNEYERRDESVAEVPDKNDEEIGIIWWNSRDDNVCEKCLEMTGRWFPNDDAFQLAKQIHPEGGCRCVKHFDVGTPSEALVGPVKAKKKMRPMTDSELVKYNAFCQGYFGINYEQIKTKFIDGLLDQENRPT
jgi:uncharacterized Zn finger protein (UPF0148 family)